MMVFRPGTYEHECPRCHRKVIFVVQPTYFGKSRVDRDRSRVDRDRWDTDTPRKRWGVPWVGSYFAPHDY